MCVCVYLCVCLCVCVRVYLLSNYRIMTGIFDLKCWILTIDLAVKFPLFRYVWLEIKFRFWNANVNFLQCWKVFFTHFLTSQLYQVSLLVFFLNVCLDMQAINIVTFLNNIILYDIVSCFKKHYLNSKNHIGQLNPFVT